MVLVLLWLLGLSRYTVPGRSLAQIYWATLLDYIWYCHQNHQWRLDNCNCQTCLYLSLVQWRHQLSLSQHWPRAADIRSWYQDWVEAGCGHSDWLRSRYRWAASASLSPSLGRGTSVSCTRHYILQPRPASNLHTMATTNKNGCCCFSSGPCWWSHLWPIRGRYCSGPTNQSRADEPRSDGALSKPRTENHDGRLVSLSEPWKRQDGPMEPGMSRLHGPGPQCHAIRWEGGLLLTAEAPCAHACFQTKLGPGRVRSLQPWSLAGPGGEPGWWEGDSYTELHH